MNDKLVPGDRLLPEFSILEKIEALRPESVNEIFDNFQTIAEQRRAEAREASSSINLKEIFKRAFSDTFFGTFFYYFRPWQHTRDTFKQLPNPSSAMNRGWAVTGDDLRAAINDYIETHGLAAKLSLTDKERKSLDYVALDHTRDNTRPDVPLFKKRNYTP